MNHIDRHRLRLRLALEDIEAASRFATEATLYQWVKPRTLSLEELRDALWTSAVVSYARPFTASKLAAPNSLQRFPAEPDLAPVHAKTLELRHKLFAHTDDAGHREVYDGQHRRVALGAGFASRFRSLCSFQLDRLAEMLDEVPAEAA